MKPVLTSLIGFFLLYIFLLNNCEGWTEHSLAFQLKTLKSSCFLPKQKKKQKEDILDLGSEKLQVKMKMENEFYGEWTNIVNVLSFTAYYTHTFSPVRFKKVLL